MSMASMQGDPVKGELHSANASAGVVLVLYRQGEQVAYTLAANEYLEVHSLELISAPGGDVEMYFGTSGTPGTGTEIVRGTVAANGGIVKAPVMRTGLVGQNVWCIAPSGVVDAKFNGTIRRQPPAGTRANYQASLVPGNASFTS